jgi:filamentous hemagglutinin
VQFGVEGEQDAQARTFLSQAHGMLEADPACPTCGPGYMFYATPEQRANAGMYATEVVTDPNTLAFTARNGITQPTTQQITDTANNDTSTRTAIGNATVGAAGVALATTVLPALSWCLSNPVACNRVVIAGGEIAAGDALGPTSLAAIGTISSIKAVRSADEVNTAMKAKGWEPAWSPGTPVIETTLQPGTKVNMIVDAKTADAIKKGDPIIPGGWATFDDVNSVAVDMRQQAAITSQFKKPTDGPFYVIEMEITQPVTSNIGFVGKQTDTTGGLLRGGGTQVQFDEAIKGMDRNTFIKAISLPKPLQ